jgi:hypothetical protein
MTYAPGDSLREADRAAMKRMREAEAAAERVKVDRIERWAVALSVLPEYELDQCAQGWSSFTEAVKPACQRAIEIQRERRGEEENAKGW